MSIRFLRSSSLTDGFVINGSYTFLALLKMFSGCTCYASWPLAISFFFFFVDQSYTQSQILALLSPCLIQKNKNTKGKGGKLNGQQVGGKTLNDQMDPTFATCGSMLRLL